MSAKPPICNREAGPFPSSRLQGMGAGIPELKSGSIEEIVHWYREARGHDEEDGRVFGIDRFGACN
jgi:hypothetical protein